MARLAKDYQTYSTKSNVTFVGISTDVDNTEKRMRSQIDLHNLKPYAHVLDNTGALAAAYQVPQKVPLTIVIVDAEGKIALNVGWGSFYGSKDNPTYAYIKALNESLEKAPGALGDLKPPAGCERAAHMFGLQQFDQMEMEFAKIPQNAEVKAFREGVKAKVDAYTKQRLAELQALGDTDPLVAYQETQAFARAFRTAKEFGAAQSLASKLGTNPVVKKETEAEAMYQRIVAPEMVKATTLPVYEKKVKPLMDGYLQRYGDTKYGMAMKSVHDAMTKRSR